MQVVPPGEPYPAHDLSVHQGKAVLFMVTMRQGCPVVQCWKGRGREQKGETRPLQISVKM